MGGDVRRRNLPTLERGSHEPKRYEAYEGDDERLAVFGRHGRTIPTQPTSRDGEPWRDAP
jgi:hypothetical protein